MYGIKKNSRTLEDGTKITTYTFKANGDDVTLSPSIPRWIF